MKNLIIIILLFCIQCSDSYRIKHFNKDASSPETEAESIINIINLSKGDFIGDIGAGGGYFSILFAERVGPEGKVYAVDINKTFLKYIDNLAQKNQLNNIITIHSEKNESKLPENKLDILFFRNVLHHIPEPVQYMIRIKSKLKEDGRVVIVEKKGGSLLHKVGGHFLKPKQIQSIMKKAEYKMTGNITTLATQHMMIFSKK